MYIKNIVFQCVTERYKTQKTYDKAVNTYPFTIKLLPECYKTPKMSDKAVNRRFFVLVCGSIPDWYKTQEICHRVVTEDSFSTVYFPDR